MPEKRGERGKEKEKSAWIRDGWGARRKLRTFIEMWTLEKRKGIDAGTLYAKNAIINNFVALSFCDSTKKFLMGSVGVIWDCCYPVSMKADQGQA